jgi:hypothetical protein
VCESAGVVVKDGEAMECMWVGKDDDDRDAYIGKCVDFIPEYCLDVKNIRNGTECNNHNSMKGKCFFNGDVETSDSEGRCSDVEDVMECGDLKEFMLCSYATKEIYPNLIIDPSSTNSTFYCIWDVEAKFCFSKKSFKGGLRCEEIGIDVCDRMEACAVIAGFFLSLFLLKKKKRKMKKKVDYENYMLCDILFDMFVFCIEVFVRTTRALGGRALGRMGGVGRDAWWMKVVR